ncbi:hypothetical protein ACFFJ4_18880, partial [Xanthomonas dyei]
VGVHGCKQGMVCCLDNAAFDQLRSALRSTGRLQQSNRQLSNAISKPSGAVSSPLAGPCGGMDAATEPTGTYLRRVP